MTPTSKFRGGSLTAISIALLMAGCSSSGPPLVVAEIDATDPTPAPHESWQLVWSDEFNTDKLDLTKWSYEENCWGGGNGEQQCYTKRKSNIYLDDGRLHIRARRGEFTGPDNPEGNDASVQTLPYTSARIRTIGKGDWKYGRFEIRAKMPSGQGTWPAIWMLPTDYVYGGWAASGEIDIMEAVNLKVPSDANDENNGKPESRIYGTLHYGGGWPDNKHSGQEYYLPDGMNPADSFHTYAVEWEEGEIRWYVDGFHYATQRAEGWYSMYEENGKDTIGEFGAPFNQRFHMLLNVAVGGSWAGNTHEGGINKSAFPQIMEVDYVRVYECSVDPDTGKGCATIGDQATLVKGVQPPEIIEVDESYAKGPVFNLFDGELDRHLRTLSYDPDGNITFGEVADPDYGQVLQIAKAGALGNFYLESPKVDMTRWEKGSELVFDLKIEENASNSELLVKLDSGWPNVSDYSVKLPAVGEWVEVRIKTSDIVSNGNRFASGQVNMSQVSNVLVVEPLGEMTLKMANIRFEQK